MKTKLVLLLIFIISTLHGEDLSSTQKRDLQNAIYYLEKAEQAPSIPYIKTFLSYAERYADKLFAEIPDHEEVQKLRLRVHKVKKLTQTKGKKLELTYRDKLALKSVQSLLEQASRVSDIEIIAKRIEQAKKQLLPLQQKYPQHPQVSELGGKVKNLEAKVNKISSEREAEENAYTQDVIAKGMNAIRLLKQACDANFDEKKMVELAGEKPNLRKRRYSRHGNSDSGDFVRKKAQEIQKAMSNAAVKKGFVDLCNDVNSFSERQFQLAQANLAIKEKRNQGPLVFQRPFKKFLELHKKPKLILFTFSGQIRHPSIASHCEAYKAFTERAERYIQFLYKCEAIRNAREKELQSFRKQNIAEAQQMVHGDEILQDLLDYYAVFGDKFNVVKSSLQNLKQDLLARIEVASKKAAKKGFAKFKSQYQEVKADRHAMLKSAGQYQGKIIADAKFPVVSWTKKGWFLPHGNEMFSYVWDPILLKKFREVEVGQFNIFRNFRNQIVEKHGLTLENQMDWKYPGLVDVEFVAIIDGTTFFTPVREIKDRYGKVVYTQELPAIQVVNARVVGLKSRYFTLWLGGTDTNKELDLSGLPK